MKKKPVKLDPACEMLGGVILVAVLVVGLLGGYLWGAHRRPVPADPALALQIDKAKAAVLNGDLARAREVLGVEVER